MKTLRPYCIHLKLCPLVKGNCVSFVLPETGMNDEDETVFEDRRGISSFVSIVYSCTTILVVIEAAYVSGVVRLYNLRTNSNAIYIFNVNTMLTVHT